MLPSLSKKTAAAVLALACCLSLPACKKTDILPARNEIETYEVMKILGLDRSGEDPELVEITFLSERATGSGGGDSGGAPKKNYPYVSSKAATAFEAERRIKSHSDKKQFFGYVDYILLGEKAAADDLSKYFDFVVRDHEIRLSPKVYIIKGLPVKDFVRETSSSAIYLGDRLDNIKSDIADMSTFDEVTIVDLAQMMNNSQAAIVLPVLSAGGRDVDDMIGGKMPEKDACSSGYAVLKDFRLVGYIQEPDARGYNFLTGRVHSSAVSVNGPAGLKVGLEIINERTKIETRFNGDHLDSVTYKTHIYANVDDVQARSDVFTGAAIDFLCDRLSEVVKSEMERVIALSKDWQTDCIELGERLRRTHPLKWEKLKDRWNEIYPTLTITAEVSTDLRRTYDIRQPNGYAMGN